MFRSTDNNINGNTILNNRQYGIYLSGEWNAGSTNNNICHNNFIDNSRQVRLHYATNNLFDAGYPDGGNYWSNYTGADEKSGENQDQSGSDGIGDTPYTFTSGQDNYPFIEESGWELPSVPTYNVAVILAESNDINHISSSITARPCKLLSEKTYPDGHGKEYYQDLAYCVADYHKENSFGTVNLNFTIYDNGGEWLRTDKNEQDYLGEEDEFVIDAITSAQNKGIELADYDIVIVVHSGTSYQRAGGTKFATCTWTVDDQPLGYPPYKIIVAEDDVIGGWAHEIGHIVGALVTPENTITPDLYKMGNTGEWDLMATGSWNNGLFNKGINPPFMSSYTKEFLGWLNYNIHPKSAYGEYWINSLETSELEDKVFRYNLTDDVNDESSKYFILETRNRDLKTWDSSLPGLTSKHLVLYYVDTKGLPEHGYVPEGVVGYQEGMMWNQYRIVTIPGIDSINDGILNPLINETYRDLDNLVKFSAITDRTVNDKYEMQARIEEITNDSFSDKFWGVVLRPKSTLRKWVEGIFNPNSIRTSEFYEANNSSSEMQLTVHYSTNSLKASMGSPCPLRTGYIVGTIVDIIPASQDVSFKKENSVFIGPTGTYEGFLKSLEAPNSRYTAEDYRILELKNSKSDSHEYVLIKKATLNRWFLRNGDEIFIVFKVGANCELYGVDFLIFNLRLIKIFIFVVLLFIISFVSLLIYYSRKIGFKKALRNALRILLSIVIAIIIIFLVFLLLIYLDVISPQSITRIISPQIFANNSISASFNPPLEPTTSPDLDLHLYCDDGRHIGVNYGTSEYEIQIPGAIVSGDNQDAPEWIFIPKDITNCHFVVSSYDNQKFLEENPEITQEIEDTSDSYEIYARYIDPETDIYASAIIFQEIEAGIQLEHSIAGTHDITVNPGEVTIDSIIGEIYQYFNSSQIDNNGIKQSLLSKLNNAKRKIEANQRQAAINILNAFINEVGAQKGKHIKINTAEVLIKNAKGMINHL